VRSCVFDGNGQINPNDALMRLNSFSGYTGTDGALLWNANIDVEQSSFNGNNRATEHTTAGTFSYPDLTFAGNTHDIHNSSTGLVTVNAVGTSNPSTFVNSNGGTTSIQNTKQFSFTVSHDDGSALTGFEWRVYEKDPTQGIIGSELYGEETAGTSTINIQYNYTGDIVVMLQIIENGFEEYLQQYTFGDSDQSVNVTLITETNL